MIRGEGKPSALLEGGVSSAKEKFQSKCEAWNTPRSRQGSLMDGRHWEAPVRGQLKDTMEKFNRNAEKWERRGTVDEKRGSITGLTAMQEEMSDVFRAIGEHGQRSNEDGTAKITFGDLYDKCPALAKKLGSILVLARKQNYVDFEGDMLYRHGSEAVVITLLKGAADSIRTQHG